MKLEHMNVILDAFQSVGMHAKVGIFEATDYGLPQSRKRAYGVACNAALAGLSDVGATALVTNIIDYVRALLVGRLAQILELRCVLAQIPICVLCPRNSTAC
jgi:site-specific DNA-cytosine methylase